MSDSYRSPRKSWRFLSYVLTAIIIASIVSPSSAKQQSVVGIPQPVYPADAAETTSITDPPIGAPSFRWSAVSGANVYRLQVDDDIALDTPVLNITTRNTSYTPTVVSSLFADGIWYWHVRVEDPTPVSEYSSTMQFTKTWATVENKPSLIAPDDNAPLAFYDAPVFSWTRVMGATKYRLQIATDPGFADLIPNTIPDTLSASYQPPIRLANGTYYWRIFPKDAFDHLGTVSDIRSFTMAYGTNDLAMVPTLLEPEDEAFPTFTPTFHWTAVAGAEHYRLEYTSDETCDFSVGVGVETRQTSYTPTDTFPNDRRYCWRVRVDSGSAVGDWSDVRHFQKRWYLQPHLLTPTNLYQTGLYPLYSWTPVPGASRYRIDIDDEATFSNPLFETSITANTTYAPQSKYVGSKYYYWRVTPIDGGGELGMTSAVGEFRSYYDSTAPILVYPLYYYLPNDPVYYGSYSMNPVENRTATYPIFMWHRVMVPNPVGGVFAAAYRIEVDTTPYFTTVQWQYDTENTIATPINGVHDFSPIPGNIYYWRVCVLDHLGGSCVTSGHGGWSQIWTARFDPTYDPINPNPWVLPPTQGDAPELLRPAVGQESVEATPLLEWWPYETITQTQYIVEISREEDFSSYEISETVNIPAYAPWYSFAQRSLNRTDYGTFYWRVQGKVNGGVWSNWSETANYQIASQSEWRFTRSLGDIDNRLIIGEDPANDVITTTTDVLTSTYDLTTLYASQSSGSWYLGFNVDLTTTTTTYVFYIDLDHVDGSGAGSPPERPYDVATISLHRPEYVIYVDKIGGVINASHVYIYSWNGVAWSFYLLLSDIGGGVSASSGYVELRLPNGSIGMSQVTSSFSVMLFSVDANGKVKDTVPSDPSVPVEPGITPELSRFSAVSEHMNLVFPPSTASGDSRTDPSLLPFYWDWPTGSDPSTPFAGSKLEVHLDSGYTNLVREFHIDSTDNYFGENNITFLNDLLGDNIYYWRVQPRYLYTGFTPAYGAWNGGWSFRRLGFTPQNLKTSVTWATPTFSWDMVEGASTYRLQVSTQDNFGSSVIDITTPMTSYTPQVTLAQGLYYWRVQVIRYNTPANDWSEVKQFNLLLPAPTGLTPDNNTVVTYAPTLCWDPLIKLNDNEPFEAILTAWKYRVQVSRDANFSVIYDWLDTYNNCWTPLKGYDDGMYYWHVAMIDGNGKFGPYNSTAATFIKQYPVTTLISPINQSLHGTPTFIWTPVNGAATYRFEVSKWPTFSPLYDSIETYNTQFTPTKKYDFDVVYYWRVAIKDRDSRQGPFTGSDIIIEVFKEYMPLINK